MRFVGIVEKAGEQKARIRVFPEYCSCLRGIEAFSHLIILYWMHNRDTEEARKALLVYPKRHSTRTLTGVFACRSPSRPNPIGLCAVELTNIDRCVLTVKGLDASADSPIIDVKPYDPNTDSIPNARALKSTQDEQ